MTEYNVRQAEQGVEDGISELERAMNELKGSWGNTARSFQGFADTAGDLAERLGSQASFVTWGSVFLSGMVAGFLLSRRRISQQAHVSELPTVTPAGVVDTSAARAHPPHGATGSVGVP